MPEPTRNRRSEQREVARAAMLETAIGLLAAHGYSGMKLADVSRDSGYSYGLAPFYFESKAGLMLAIQEEIDATFTEYMAPVCDPESSGREFVDQWVTGLFAFAKELPRPLAGQRRDPRRVGGERPSGRRRARPVRRPQRGHAAGRVRTRHRRRQHPDVRRRPHAASVTVEALVKGVNFEWFGDPTVDLDDRCRLVLDVVRPTDPTVTRSPRARSACPAEEALDGH